jgi:hypothetical protein
MEVAPICDAGSGKPAFRNPSSHRERSSAPVGYGRVFQIAYTQRRIQLPQSSYRLLRLLQPAGHRIA